MSLDLRGKKVLVVGAGRSGLAAAKLCAARGARVTLTDKRDAAGLGAALAGLSGEVGRELGGRDPGTPETDHEHAFAVQLQVEALISPSVW